WSSVRVPIAYSSSRNVTASPGVLCGCVLRVRRRTRPAPRSVCRVARYRWGRSCRSNASRLALLVSSGGPGGGEGSAHDPHRFVAVRFQAVGGEVARPEPDRVVRVERRQNFGVGRLLRGEVSTRPLRAETKADAAVHASRGWEGEPGGRVGPQLIYAILCGLGEIVGGHGLSS